MGGGWVGGWFFQEILPLRIQDGAECGNILRKVKMTKIIVKNDKIMKTLHE